MQSRDIVMQVSEETAEVMEEISEQLLEESEARFDEIVEAIEEAVKKVEKLYSEFTGFTVNANKQAVSNQMELMDKFVVVLEGIEVFKKDVSEQTVQSNKKADRLIAIMTDIPQLIQVVSNSISESAERRSEFETILLQTARGLAQSLAELQKMQFDVMDKLNSDDSQEKLISALNKLAYIEREIIQIKDVIGNVSNTLRNCNAFIEQLLFSVKGLQENVEKLLNIGEENARKVDKIGKQIDVMFEKKDDMLNCLDSLYHSVQAISEKQKEICEKQAELDKDVKYLKLPFFKRWFTKG